MTRSTLAALLVLPLLLTACSDDESGDSGGGSGGDDTPSVSLSPEESAIKEALVATFFDPSCELLTEDYLVEKALLGDTPEEACEEYQQYWVEPAYGEEDVLVSDIRIDGDVATAVVGSEYINIETTYELTNVDGTWLVSCEDFTCDYLDEPSGTTEDPSAEVS